MQWVILNQLLQGKIHNNQKCKMNVKIFKEHAMINILFQDK